MFRLIKGERLQDPDENQAKDDDTAKCVGSECEGLPGMFKRRTCKFVSYGLVVGEMYVPFFDMACSCGLTIKLSLFDLYSSCLSSTSVCVLSLNDEKREVLPIVDMLELGNSLVSPYKSQMMYYESQTEDGNLLQIEE